MSHKTSPPKRPNPLSDQTLFMVRDSTLFKYRRHRRTLSSKNFEKNIEIFRGLIADNYESSEGSRISDLRTYWCHLRTKKFGKTKKTKKDRPRVKGKTPFSKPEAGLFFSISIYLDNFCSVIARINCKLDCFHHVFCWSSMSRGIQGIQRFDCGKYKKGNSRWYRQPNMPRIQTGS